VITVVIFSMLSVVRKLKSCSMRSLGVAAFWCLCLAVVLPLSSLSQEDGPESDRKVVSRVSPIYPQLARASNLRGTVRLNALVASNGTVKSVALRGGNPVLAKAAEDAVRKWKWAPATHDSREAVEVRFDPP